MVASMGLAQARMAVIVALLVVMVGVLTTGCTIAPSKERDGIGVIVTIGPQREMAERIGGGLVHVTVMVPPNASPHTYSPTPSQMKDVADAEVYLKVGSGIEFEQVHMDTVKENSQDMDIVDCSVGITLIPMVEHEDDGEEEEEDHHDEGALDPHIWTSPVNMMTMARNVRDGYIKVDPDNKATYDANLEAYLADLRALDIDMRAAVAGHENDMFLVYHPAWGYLAKDYNLTQLAIEKGGKDPGPAGLVAIIEQAKEHNITVIFVEPQFDTSRAETIAQEIGGEVVVVDPLGDDYLVNMRNVATKLAAGLSAG